MRYERFRSIEDGPDGGKEAGQGQRVDVLLAVRLMEGWYLVPMLVLTPSGRYEIIGFTVSVS